jgi:hypothetical protein
MTPNSPSPYSYSGTATRTRVKWDNIAIVLMGAVVAVFAVVGIMLTADKPAATPKPRPEAATSTELLEDTATEPAAGELTIDDANALIEEAKGFMAEARWDEAADRLATIPEEFRAEVGAEALEAQLAELRTQHDKLRAELTAAVEARQFKQAKGLLKQLAAIAALDADLLAIQEQVDAALAPTPAAKPKPATDDSSNSNATSTTGGGGSSSTHANHSTSTKPTGTKPKPKPKPATTGGGGSTNNSSSTGTGGTANIDLGALGIDQEELDAAVASAEAGDLDGIVFQ